MDVIALISGGKDSFFSLLHCIANGHRIVALANLHPPTPNTPSSVTTHLPTTAPHTFTSPTSETKDELDSFMYQTVGHGLLPFYPNALGVPLYRYPITGSSVDQNLSYKFSTAGEGSDETEDLVPLLKYILERYPGVKAISTGAILSTYQRTRIESVCDRLGLTSLSYLWQRPQSALLEEMDLVGLDARIVKVAAIGLDAEKWIWKNVADIKTRMLLEGLQKKWGVHMAGEGGEYETIVVDGPGWRGRIEVGEGEREVVDGGGGVGHLKVLGARFIERDGEVVGQEEWVKDLKKPNLWDPSFEDILKTLNTKEIKEATTSTIENAMLANGDSKVVSISTKRIGKLLFIANVGPDNNFTGTIPEEISFTMNLLKQQLEKHNTDFSRITSTTLLLRSMSDFVAINKIYSSYFNTPNPPSRVCVSIGSRMPKRTNIMLSCTVDLPATSTEESGRRKGLHVQSRSYWAPANIGPYSQAISVDGWTALAGMIPLVPSTMEVVNSGIGEREIQEQAVLALQHMWRVAKATDVTTLLGCVAYVVNDMGMQAATEAWREFWKGWRGEAGWKDLFGSKNEDEDEDSDIEPEMGGGIHPPLLIVSVEELPRSCAVEWAGIGFDPEWIQKMRNIYYTDDDNDAAKSSDEWGVKPGIETPSHDLISSSSMFYGGWSNGRGIPLPSGGSGVSVLCFAPSSAKCEAERCATLVKEVMEKVGHEEMGFLAEEMRVYIPASTGTAGEFSEAWDHAKGSMTAAIMVIPVSKVWDCDGRNAGLGVVVRRVGPQLG